MSFHYIGYTSLIDYPLEIKLFKTGYYIYMKLKNNCLRTGAYILIDSLIQNGVEHIFLVSGGAILPIYDELYHWEKSEINQTYPGKT